jgi:hypothetical protein
MVQTVMSVDVSVIKRLRVLLKDRLHADEDEMTHHLHDVGIITCEQRDAILTASNAPMQRCRNVLDLLVYRNGFFDSFVYCLEIMGKMNLARLLRLYRTATMVIRTICTAIKDTQPLMMSEDEEHVHCFGEKLKARRFVQEECKFFQLLRKVDATGKFTGVGSQTIRETLLYFQLPNCKTGGCEHKRGEKLETKIDLGEELVVTINWR